jgi:hypothetical protein
MSDSSDRLAALLGPALGPALPHFAFAGLPGALVRVRGSAVFLPYYLAVIEGVRRSLDDWILLDRLDEYLAVCRRLGLVVEIDCVFRSRGRVAHDGRRNGPPTTLARGFAYSLASRRFRPTDRVHVFVSRRREWSTAALAAGWYPLHDGHRFATKPIVDHGRLGLAFGYPDCCTRFFTTYNDWPRFNTIAEAARASSHYAWVNNCLLKSTAAGLQFHMPCRFDCTLSQILGEQTFALLESYDREYAVTVASALSQMFLSVHERLAFMLFGARIAADGSVRYIKAIPLFGGSPSHVHWASKLQAGDRLSIREGTVLVYRGTACVASLGARCDQGIAEVPILLDFKQDAE